MQTKLNFQQPYSYFQQPYSSVFSLTSFRDHYSMLIWWSRNNYYQKSNGCGMV